MTVLVTGSNGFIGKNLIIRLKEKNIPFISFTRKNSKDELKTLINNASFIFHLAGENRPKEEKDFESVNAKLTSFICKEIKLANRNIPIIYSSSSQAELDNSYGRSKYNGEIALKNLAKETGNDVYIYRLPGVFGKWSKANYNSVVSTFCHNVANNLPLQVNNPLHELKLVYIDDVISDFLNQMQNLGIKDNYFSVQPEYLITLGELAEQIKAFKASRNSLVSERVGIGLTRKLYATYVSYLLPQDFVYSISTNGDQRGMFAEFFKTKDSGQFSFFTAKPGVTRGGHYHHSKTEKFLVIQGDARFCFKHIISGETSQIKVSGKELKIVETVPGWAHDITNEGNQDLIALLWANEIFDPENPDTISSLLG